MSNDPNLQYLAISSVAVTDGRSMTPVQGSYYTEAVKRTIVDPVTGESRVVETFKPKLVGDDSNKLILHRPNTQAEARIELNEGTILRITPSASLRNIERYIVGDLVLIRDMVFTLEYSDKPITEILTGIPDIAPLPISLANLFPNGTSLYPKHKYKTQRQLIDHIKNRNSLFNEMVSLQIQQPEEVLARNSASKKLALKDTLRLREEQYKKELAAIEAELNKLS
jgi:hypothetical protein